MNTRNLLALATALVCASCAPTPPPRAIIYKPATPAAKTEAASPTLDKAQRTHADADAQSGRVADSVTRAKAGVNTLGDKLAELVATSARLEQTNLELGEFHRQLVEREKEARGLAAELDSTSGLLAAERALRIAGRDQLHLASSQVRAKEGEADQLRAQLTETIDANVAIKDAADHNAEAARTATAKNGKLQGEVDTWRKIAGALLILFTLVVVVIVLIRNARRVVNPLS